MILNPGEMVLFDRTQKNEVLEILSREGYKFWHGGPLPGTPGDKYGVRWSPDRYHEFPDCIATMTQFMADNVRTIGQVDRSESIKWTILEYEDFLGRVYGSNAVVDDLL